MRYFLFFVDLSLYVLYYPTILRELQSVKQTDNEMTKLIKGNFNEKSETILQKQCTKQCQTGELKSMQEFLEKVNCFKENWMSVSKPKHAGVSDPNKQKNNMQYQIYYRNEYNQDKKQYKKHLQIYYWA